MKLSKTQRALLRALHSRHGRKKHRLCVCEGVRAVSELLRARPDLVEFSVGTEAAAATLALPEPCFLVSESDLAELSATVQSQGVMVVARLPEAEPDAPTLDPFVLALDRVADPGNFGTICRTARAAGLRELWYTAGTVDPFGDKALRSALGAPFSMRLREFADLAALRDAAAARGYGPVYLTDPAGGEDCFRAVGVYDRTVIVIGNEANGAAELSGAPKLTIPMPGGFESLNAAQAATILIFEYVRRTGLEKK